MGYKYASPGKDYIPEGTGQIMEFSKEHPEGKNNVLCVSCRRPLYPEEMDRSQCFHCRPPEPKGATWNTDPPKPGEVKAALERASKEIVNDAAHADLHDRHKSAQTDAQGEAHLHCPGCNKQFPDGNEPTYSPTGVRYCIDCARSHFEFFRRECEGPVPGQALPRQGMPETLLGRPVVIKKAAAEAAADEMRRQNVRPPVATYHQLEMLPMPKTEFGKQAFMAAAALIREAEAEGRELYHCMTRDLFTGAESVQIVMRRKLKGVFTGFIPLPPCDEPHQVEARE